MTENKEKNQLSGCPLRGAVTAIFPILNHPPIAVKFEMAAGKQDLVAVSRTTAFHPVWRGNMKGAIARSPRLWRRASGLRNISEEEEE